MTITKTWEGEVDGDGEGASGEGAGLGTGAVDTSGVLWFRAVGWAHAARRHIESARA